MIDNETFIAAARAVYGEDWQSPLARRTGHGRQSIRRWAKGTHPVPQDVAAAIIEDYRAKKSAVSAAVNKLAKRAGLRITKDPGTAPGSGDLVQG